MKKIRKSKYFDFFDFFNFFSFFLFLRFFRKSHLRLPLTLFRKFNIDIFDWNNMEQNMRDSFWSRITVIRTADIVWQISSSRWLKTAYYGCCRNSSWFGVSSIGSWISFSLCHHIRNRSKYLKIQKSKNKVRH